MRMRGAGSRCRRCSASSSGLNGPWRQRRRGAVALVALERGQAVALVDALGFVGEQHRVAVEGDAHLVRMRVGGPRRVRDDTRRGHGSVQRRAHVGFVGGQEQVRVQRLEVAPRTLAAGEHAALDRQPVVLAGAEYAHARYRVVARQDHDLDMPGVAVVEGQQLVHQRERRPRPRRLLQPAELQLHVGAVVAGLEDSVLLFEVEQRARGDGDDEAAIEGGGHRAMISSAVENRRPLLAYKRLPAPSRFGAIVAPLLAR
jgi:hypothetical protein